MKNKKPYLLPLLLTWLIFPGISAQKHHKVILMAGQSNMVGVGEVNLLPEEYKKEQKDIQIYVSWHVSPVYQNKWIPVQPNLGAELNDFGPEISFARKLKELHPGENLALIKISRGATDLYNDWRSISAATETHPVGLYYTNFIKRVHLALEALPEGDTWEIAGMLWMQGESDGTDRTFSDAYESNLRWFIYDVRNELGVPDMPFIIGKIDEVPAWKYATGIRQAQDKIASSVNNVGIFDTKGIATDGVHYTTSGNLALGDSFAIHLTQLLNTKTDIGLKNDVMEIRCDLTRGGSIYYLSPSDKSMNLVNTHDEGRYIQQSYYAGYERNRQPEGQNPNWSPWPWNPIQAGDCYGNKAEVLDFYESTDSLYIKSTPLLWDMNFEPAECDFEQWITLNGNVAHVVCKLTTFRTDNIWPLNNRDQELPAVYTIGDLSRMVSYKGDQPWTNDAVSEIFHNGPPWTNWFNPEHWAAYVNNNYWGLGVYNETCTEFLGGFAGTNRWGNTYDGSTGYISPLNKAAIGKNTIFNYDYYLILGTIDEIRKFAYDKNAETGTSVNQSLLSGINKENLKIYPNPAYETIYLEPAINPDQKLRIISSSGHSISFKSTCNSNHQQISVGHLPPGIYVLQLINTNSIVQQKFIKN